MDVHPLIDHRPDPDHPGWWSWELAAADRFLAEPPVTVTASRSPRSAGGLHDFHSEGDYWWPDPDHPDGPYIQRDGRSNPDNFVEHRRHLMRLSVQVPALAAAWKITGDARYAVHAGRHLRAWFLDDATLWIAVGPGDHALSVIPLGE